MRCRKVRHLIWVSIFCLDINNLQGEEVQCGLEILTCNPSIQIYDLTSFIVSNSMERSIGLKRVDNVSSAQAKTKQNRIFHLA